MWQKCVLDEQDKTCMCPDNCKRSDRSYRTSRIPSIVLYFSLQPRCWKCCSIVYGLRSLVCSLQNSMLFFCFMCLFFTKINAPFTFSILVRCLLFCNCRCCIHAFGSQTFLSILFYVAPDYGRSVLTHDALNANCSQRITIFFNVPSQSIWQP